MKRLKKRWSFKDGSAFDAYGSTATMGYHLLAGMVAGIFIGYWLDLWLETGHLMKGICFFVGLAGGFWAIYRDTQQILRRQKERDRQRHEKARAETLASAGNAPASKAEPVITDEKD